MPAQFLCPITHTLMMDPVFTADGHTYEREVIEQWLETHDTSPLTNEVLAHKHVTPNVALRTLISERGQAVLRRSLPQPAPSSPSVQLQPPAPAAAAPPDDLLSMAAAAGLPIFKDAGGALPLTPTAGRGRGGRGGRGAGRGTGKLIAPAE